MTLLIKNVQLVDGIHDFPERSDVFVAAGKISAIGSFPTKSASTVLDGQGAYLAPGFIDVNTDSDHYLTLLAYPGQADFLKQGVTTIFGGMCGASLAPLLYGSLESIEKWGTPRNVNVSWHTMREFLAALDALKLGVNFGTLVGHATVRRAIAGDDARELTKNETGIVEKTLRTALEEGAFGISTGLGYVHGRQTSTAELKWLLGIVKDARGVYATHLRDTTGGIADSVKETLGLVNGSGVRTVISHFVPFAGTAKAYGDARAMIEALPEDRPVKFDLYPFAETMLPFHALLPVWAQGDVKSMAANVNDPWMVSRIIKDMEPLDGQACTVARAPGHEFLIGKTLSELCEVYSTVDTREAFVGLCATTGVRGTMLCRNLDEGALRDSLASPHSFIASNAPGFNGAPPGNMVRSDRTTSTFTKFLGMVQDENLLPLKDAVRKLSYEPASFFGLAGRGELREGAIADLACFKGSEVRFTVVGGTVAVKDGEFQGIHNGKVLRRGK